MKKQHRPDNDSMSDEYFVFKLARLFNIFSIASCILIDLAALAEHGVQAIQSPKPINSIKSIFIIGPITIMLCIICLYGAYHNHRIIMYVISALNLLVIVPFYFKTHSIVGCAVILVLGVPLFAQAYLIKRQRGSALGIAPADEA